MRARATGAWTAVSVAAVLLVASLAMPASAATAADVTGLSTHVASAHGYTIVHVYGTRLGTATQVRFGPYLAGHLVRHSDHDLSVLVPVTDRDLTTFVTVTTTAAGRTSSTDPQAQFTFIRPPTIGAVTPNTGGVQGGRRSTITGTDLVGVRAVLVGGARATALNSVNSRRVDFTAPPHAAGVVTVQVITWYGASTQAIHYRFVPPPGIAFMAASDDSRSTYGPAAGGDVLQIYGGDFTGWTRVTIGGTEVTPLTAGAQRISFVVPPHLPGPAPVKVTTAYGTNETTPDNLYTYTGPNPDSWTATAGKYNSSAGGISDLACPDDAFCAAVDYGDLYVRQNGRWSPAVSTGAMSPGAVSCSGPSWCLAVGSAAWVWDGTSWAGTTAPPAVMRSVSCPAREQCWGVDGAGGIRSFGPDGWSDVIATGSGRISCPTTSFCVAVNDHSLVEYDGTSWAAASPPTDSFFVDVSCDGPRMCAAVDRSGGVAMWDGTAWSFSGAVLPSAAAKRVSCVAGTCNVLNDTMVVSHYDGERWSSSATPLAAPGYGTNRYRGSYVALACSSATRCIAADAWGETFTYDGAGGAGWVGPEETFAFQGYLSAMSCVSLSWCMTSDVEGNASVFDGSSFGRVTRVLPDSEHQTNVSCASPTFCMMTSSLGRTAVYDGASWHQVGTRDPRDRSVSCVQDVCVTAGGVWDGTRWRDLAEPAGLGVHPSVSCASPQYCAVAGAGRVAVFDGRTWGPVTILDPAGVGYDTVRCTSPGWCFALLGGTAAMYVLQDGRWSLVGVILPGGVQDRSIACTSDTFCAVVGPAGDARVFDGTSFSDKVRVSGNATPTAVSGVACVQPHRCIVMNANRAFVSQHG